MRFVPLLLLGVPFASSLLSSTRSSPAWRGRARKVKAPAKVAKANATLDIAEDTAACAGGNVKADTVVIIRTHKPMEGMIARFQKYYEDITANMPSAVLAVSFDSSNMPTAEGLEYLYQMKKEAPKILFHTYDWSTVVKNYPVLKELKFASGWNMHVEPLLDAVDFVRNNTCVARNAKFWAIEDDVFFCGNASKILGFYRSDPSDLLYTQSLSEIRKWPWRRKASRSFRHMFRLHERSALSEVMQRFSARLLGDLKSLSHMGVTAWSEMYPSTVCERGEYLCTRLRDEHVGKTAWNYRATKEESQSLCKDATISRMNHAAKFSAEGPAELRLLEAPE